MASKRTRVSRHRVSADLSPAWAWTLMTGGLSGDESDSIGLPGWLAQLDDAVLMAGEYDYAAAGARLWAEHGDALHAQAEPFGFEPFWVTNRTPTSPGFRRWRSEFLREHRRRSFGSTQQGQ